MRFDKMVFGSQLTHRMAPPSNLSGFHFFKFKNRTTNHPVLKFQKNENRMAGCPVLKLKEMTTE